MTVVHFIISNIPLMRQYWLQLINGTYLSMINNIMLMIIHAHVCIDIYVYITIYYYHIQNNNIHAITILKII